MALKIASNKPLEPPTEEPIEGPEIEVEAPVEEVPEEAAPEIPIEMGFVDPISARYFGPEHSCAGCIHFMNPNACEVVSGPIDPGGICSIYTPDNVEAEDIEDDASDLMA